MAPDARGLLRLLVLSFIAFTSVRSGSPPTITAEPRVATLLQYESSSVILSTVTCQDPDKGTCSVSLSRVYPSNPCGNCFSIFPCVGTIGYCVKYSPRVGYFNPSVESQYLLTVTATDDKLESDPVLSTTIVDVRIIPNSLPVFATYPVMTVSRTVTNAKGTGSGVPLYTVIANDIEGDALTFTMTTVPDTDSFEIDPISGVIRTTKPLRFECRSNIAALVYVQDNTGTQVGPFVVNIELNNLNSAPIITNLNSEIRVRENEALNNLVMKLAMFDDDDDTVTCTVSTSPASAANLFQIVSNELRVKSAIDFETQPQTITMTIKASDGYCTSESYTLTVKLVDINEPPTLGPIDQTVVLCEGHVDIVRYWNATDVDAHDKGLLRYVSVKPTIPSGLDWHFAIDEQTGVVSTLVDYDVDQNNMPPIVTLETILSDVQGLSATATLTVHFRDCNDNAPTFEKNVYTWDAKECDPPGTIPVTLMAVDLDSVYEQNNVVTFSGSAPGIMVQPDGAVVTTSTMAAGTVVTMEVYATDKGKTPGPLTSKFPAYVSVSFTECTTPPPPPTRITVTTTEAVTTPANVADFLDVNLGWIVVAALIGTLLTGLTIYMLYRYCWPRIMKLIKAGCCKSRPPPRTVTPVRRPTPPPQKQKPSPGFIFGWWKEQYPNDDYKHEPDRLALPEPSKSIDTPIDTNTRDIDPVVPPTPPPSAYKSCTIL